MTSKLVLATGNPGKLAEIKQLLGDREVIAQSTLDIVSVEETGLSFVENAILKARHACQYGGLPALADDSGLEVDALQGQPGIYSARYAGEGATDSDNLQKLLKELQSSNNRRARFRCVMVYMSHQHDPSPIICSGSWDGEIALAPSGDNGFGYDPVFLVTELGKTAAQLSAAEKNARSHRGKALAQLRKALQES